MYVESKRDFGWLHVNGQMLVTAKAYLQEAKWLSQDYVATFKEYKENGANSSGYLTLLTISFLGMVDEGTLDVLEWLNTSPPLLVNSSLIGRFCDDITSCEVHTNPNRRRDIMSK